MRATALVAAAAAAALVLASCGDATSGGTTPDVAAGADPAAAAPTGAPAATVDVLGDRVAIAAGGVAEAATASSGDLVGEGDRVETDATGLGELAYADGSFSRVGPDSTLTIERLRSTADTPDVRLALDVGRTFHAVRSTAEAGRFEVATAVAVAAVRGTVFAVICMPATTCTVIVVEGTVVVTGPTGIEVEVVAGQQVTVDQDGIDDPVAALPEPWVDDNVALGIEPRPPAGGDGGGDVPAADGAPPSAQELWTLDDLTAATAAHAWDGTAWAVDRCSDPDRIETTGTTSCGWSRFVSDPAESPIATPQTAFLVVRWVGHGTEATALGECQSGQDRITETRQVDATDVEVSLCSPVPDDRENPLVRRQAVGNAIATAGDYQVEVTIGWLEDASQNVRLDTAVREAFVATLVELVAVGLTRLV